MAQRLTILQVNDTHSYLEPHTELFWEGGHAVYRQAGGYSWIAGLIGKVREERPGAVLVLDCGDTIHGTYPAVQSRGGAMVPVLNALQFDAMTAHWEFAYGPQRFKEIARDLDYPVLALNCYDEATGGLVFDPFTVREAGGLTIGILGIAATIVDKTMPPSFSEGISLTLGREELPGAIARLREEERVDLVVLISHLGFPQEVQLASEVAGIDVLLSAHTHNRLYRPAVVHDTVIIQSGCHGSFVGRLDLTVEDHKVAGFRHELITVDETVPSDPEVGALVASAMEPHREYLDAVVGETATPLHRYAVLESTMDHLLLQALLDASGAQMAFSNGWRYGAPVPPGPVTRNDLWNIIPVNPPVSVVELTGAELRAMMENNLEHTFSRDPYQQMGGYVKRCRGINCYIKVENPAGHRIQEFFVQGKRLSDEATYTAAFVTSQGVPEAYGENRHDLDLRAIDALESFLKKGTAHADLQGAVVAI
ncbi:MAG: bifunctional metallophosphatase/5'-nucleotidase [Methanomicrobiaceae archaeon]|nr:bifunctional metallophosphatase/5'-nucleotidase [Methanomicrobiaceae archaeon]